MEIPDYVGALRRSWLVIVIIMLCGAAIGFGVARGMSPQYRATTNIFVSAQQGDTPNELLQGSTYTQNLMQSYAQLAKLPSVLGPIIDDLNLKTSTKSLADSITVNTPLNTVIIEVSVSNGSPQKAARIANAVTDALAQQAGELSPRLANGKPAIVMQQIGQAQPPENPYAPNTRFFVATGAIAGLIIGMIFALARQMFGTKIRSEADLERETELPILGTVPAARGKALDPLPMCSNSHGETAEAFRRIAANLEFIHDDSANKSVMVSSPVTGEGKSSVAINLALALAESFSRVLLVDADLRRPMLAEYCRIESAHDLTGVLRGNTQMDDAVVSWGAIDVLPAGQAPPNPQQLVSSEAMTDLVRASTQQYDVIILDSAPILSVADSLALSRMVDGVLIVAQPNLTRRTHLASAIRSVEAVGASISGVVLNRSRLERHPWSYDSLPAPARENRGDESPARSRRRQKSSQKDDQAVVSRRG